MGEDLYYTIADCGTFKRIGFHFGKDPKNKFTLWCKKCNEEVRELDYIGFCTLVFWEHRARPLCVYRHHLPDNKGVESRLGSLLLDKDAKALLEKHAFPVIATIIDEIRLTLLIFDSHHDSRQFVVLPLVDEIWHIRNRYFNDSGGYITYGSHMNLIELYGYDVGRDPEKAKESVSKIIETWVKRWNLDHVDFTTLHYSYNDNWRWQDLWDWDVDVKTSKKELEARYAAEIDNIAKLGVPKELCDLIKKYKI